MMDNNLVLSDAQAVTATASSTKSLDWATATREIGDGKSLELIVTVQTTCLASGGASNVTFSLDDSADNSSFAVVLQTIAIAKASLVAGFEALRIRLPAGLRRYIQVTYTVDTNNLTSGAFNAWVAIDRQNNVARPSGFTIL